MKKKGFIACTCSMIVLINSPGLLAVALVLAWLCAVPRVIDEID